MNWLVSAQHDSAANQWQQAVGDVAGTACHTHGQGRLHSQMLLQHGKASFCSRHFTISFGLDRRLKAREACAQLSCEVAEPVARLGFAREVLLVWPGELPFEKDQDIAAGTGPTTNGVNDAARN